MYGNTSFLMFCWIINYCPTGSSEEKIQKQFPTCQVVEQGGTNEVAQCSFPFMVDGKTFTKCTDYLDPDGNFWCSTKTDPDTFQHSSGHGFWGFCEDVQCIQAKGKLVYVDWLTIT